MKTLDRYIGTHVVFGTLLALAVLLSLFTFVDFVDDLDAVGRGQYTVWRALEYMFLGQMPKRTFELFPVAALIGALLGLGLLAANSELTVIRAAGVSVSRIALSVLRAGAALVVLALFVGEIITPFTGRIAESHRSMAMSDQITLRTENGLWIRDGISFVNIRKALPDKRMADIYIYEFDDQHRLRVSTRAAQAEYRDGNWQLEGIHQSVLTGTDGVKRRKMEKAVWESLFAPDVVEVVTVEPETLSIMGLFRYLRYLRDNGLSTARYELALWNKLVYPVATGVMILLAVPLALGRLRTVGVSQRLLTGALVGIVFWFIQKTAGSMGIVYSVSPFLSATLPTIAFFAIAVWLMRRVE